MVGWCTEGMVLITKLNGHFDRIAACAYPYILETSTEHGATSSSSFAPHVQVNSLSASECLGGGPGKRSSLRYSGAGVPSCLDGSLGTLPWFVPLTLVGLYLLFIHRQCLILVHNCDQFSYIHEQFMHGLAVAARLYAFPQARTEAEDAAVPRPEGQSHNEQRPDPMFDRCD
jgi:hypothetical protein